MDDTKDYTSNIVISNGWSKEIAGEEDFDKAINALTHANNIGRGLLITGEAGVGKTELMKSMYRALKCYPISWINCSNDETLRHIDRVPSDFDRQRIMFIDDLGSENGSIDFKKKSEIIGNFIYSRHLLWMLRKENPLKYKTYFTTNLNSDELNNLYGGRVFDRLCEMCVVLKLNGTSKRKKVIYG